MKLGDEVKKKSVIKGKISGAQMTSNIIKVVFLLKRNPPVNLNQVEYFVNTNNYVTAHKKALEQLALDIDRDLLHYFDNVAMTEVNVII